MLRRLIVGCRVDPAIAKRRERAIPLNRLQTDSGTSVVSLKNSSLRRSRGASYRSAALLAPEASLIESADRSSSGRGACFGSNPSGGRIPYDTAGIQRTSADSAAASVGSETRRLASLEAGRRSIRGAYQFARARHQSMVRAGIHLAR